MLYIFNPLGANRNRPPNASTLFISTPQTEAYFRRLTLQQACCYFTSSLDIYSTYVSTLDQKKIGSIMSFAVMGELLVNKCVMFTKKNGQMEALVAKGVDPLLKANPELSEISEPLLLEETQRFDYYKQLGYAHSL